MLWHSEYATGANSECSRTSAEALKGATFSEAPAHAHARLGTVPVVEGSGANNPDTGMDNRSNDTNYPDTGIDYSNNGTNNPDTGMDNRGNGTNNHVVGSRRYHS